jgi:proteasome accessory factor C
MSTGAVAQLARLLSLIPWLLARPGVPVEEAAREFGVTPTQLRKDLELAFMCGLPGHLPDDLIDVSVAGDRIVVTNADTIARPLRLHPDEAVSLLVGLQTLEQLPGAHDRDVLDRVRAKLQRAAGDAADTGRRVQVAVEAEPADEALLAALRPALERGRRLRIRYYVPARDEVTTREVDPVRVVVVDGRAYLEAWCRTAEDIRLFRLDRIEPGSLTELDVAAEVPADADRPDLSDGVFSPDPEQQLATVRVGPGGRWIAEAYPVESVEDLPDGGARVTLRFGDPGWLRRLVLRMGGTAHVESPAELAADVAATARAALTRYA